MIFHVVPFELGGWFMTSWLGSPLPVRFFAIMWNNCAKIVEAPNPSIPKRWVIMNCLSMEPPGNLEGLPGEILNFPAMIYWFIWWYYDDVWFHLQLTVPVHPFIESIVPLFFSSHSLTLEISWERYTSMDTKKNCSWWSFERRNDVRSVSTCLLHRTCTNSLGKGSREQL